MRIAAKAFSTSRLARTISTRPWTACARPILRCWIPSTRTTNSWTGACRTAAKKGHESQIHVPFAFVAAHPERDGPKWTASGGRVVVDAPGVAALAAARLSVLDARLRDLLHRRGRERGAIRPRAAHRRADR